MSRTPDLPKASRLLAEIIEHDGLTQRTAAIELGVSQQFLSELLRGNRVLSVMMALRIEAAFGLKAHDLLEAQTNEHIERLRKTMPKKKRKATK